MNKGRYSQKRGTCFYFYRKFMILKAKKQHRQMPSVYGVKHFKK